MTALMALAASYAVPGALYNRAAEWFIGFRMIVRAPEIAEVESFATSSELRPARQALGADTATSIRSRKGSQAC